MTVDHTEFTNLVELLRHRSSISPDDPAYTFLTDGTPESRFTNLALERMACAIAAHLMDAGAAGDRALLLYAPGLPFLAAFYGCLYAGVIAIPAYPPRNSRSVARISSIQADAKARFVLTSRSNQLDVERWFGAIPADPTLQFLVTDSLSPIEPSQIEPSKPSADTLAYLQYTSGSTSTPKGVMVSHGNVLRELDCLVAGWGHSANDCHVTWLPHFHDMGLIFGLLYPLYAGVPCFMMSPTSFTQRPDRWLQAISTYRGTMSAAPNFAFDLCVDTITPEQKQTLDLSSWRVAMNGAEPLRSQTLERFANTFSSVGFDPAAMYPAYGLAEATLKVTSTRRAGQSPLPLLTVATDALGNGRVVPMPDYDDIEPGTPPGLKFQTFVGCGVPDLDTRVAIVDPLTLRQRGESEVGEIWVKGSIVTSGYWQRDDDTRATFQATIADTGDGPYLRTGDLGFLASGQLYIAGRYKDLIIIRGQNYYPQDIEWTVQESHEALRKDAGAAFSIDIEGLEQLVIVQEVRRQSRKQDLADVAAAVRRAVSAGYDLPVHAVALIDTATIPKTSSGKIQRSACKAAFERGDLTCLLLDTRGARKDRDAEPRTLQEEILSKIWIDLLGLESVGLDDRFTELGGDSLTSMRMAERARQAGFSITNDDLFRFGTIRELAAVNRGEIVTQATFEVQSDGSSFVPLTPPQHRFFERAPVNVHHYNITRILTFNVPCQVENLKLAIEQLLARHDVFSLRFRKSGNHWGQFLQAPAPDSMFSRVDMSDLTMETFGPILEDKVLSWQNTLDLTNGPLMRIFLCDAPALMPQRLVIILHHLLSDAISIDRLVWDLFSLYTCIGNNTDSEPNTSPRYQDWARQLAAYAESPAGNREADLWLGMPWNCAGTIPADQGADLSRPNLLQEQSYLHGALDQEETASLVNLLRNKAGVLDVLLAALSKTYTDLSGRTHLLVDVVTHGRMPLQDGQDLSTTLGWFATHVPVILETSKTTSIADAVWDVRSTWDALPSRGQGFGLLRYLSLRSSDFQLLPVPSILVNYVGATDTSLPAGARLAPEVCRAHTDPDFHEEYRIKVHARLRESCLECNWSYNSRLNSHQSVRLAFDIFWGYIRAVASAI